MVDSSYDAVITNSKAFIYKLEVMEFAIEKATKGFLQDDKGSIFCLETRDADVTRVLLARILRTLSKEAFLNQKLDEIFTDFSDFTRMSQQQNSDWTNNFPNLLVCKVDREEELDEQSNILKSWVNIVKDNSKKIIFIVKNSKYLERIMMKIEMANFINLKFTELWEQNETSIKYKTNNCKNGCKYQANMDEQDLVNNEPVSARALDEDINVNLKKKSSGNKCRKSLPHNKAKTHCVDPVKLFTPLRVTELDTRNWSGDTQLHMAASNGETEIVKSLLAHGATKDTKNTYGKTELHLAAGKGHIAIVNILLEQGANVNATDNDLSTPLHISSRNPNSNNAQVIVELLLKFGAEAEKKSADGETPLHVASQFGHIEVVNALLQHGANINAQDNNGSSPLHEAIATNKPEVVLNLLQKGANFNIEDKWNTTPLDLARRRNDTDLIKVLEKHAGLIVKQR